MYTPENERLEPKITRLKRKTTLPETNIAPENGWLEYYFPIGMAYFSGAMLVSGRVSSKPPFLGSMLIFQGVSSK